MWGERSEKALIAAFVERIAELSPQLVTFNGSSFDLPVVRYRAMVHGAAARDYWRPCFRDTEDAVDLCDVLVQCAQHEPGSCRSDVVAHKGASAPETSSGIVFFNFSVDHLGGVQLPILIVQQDISIVLICLGRQWLGLLIGIRFGDGHDLIWNFRYRLHRPRLSVRWTPRAHWVGLRWDEHGRALRTDDRVFVEIEEFRCATTAKALRTKFGFCHRVFPILGVRGGAPVATPLKGSTGERPPASPPNSVAGDLAHMWGATPCVKLGFASRLDPSSTVCAWVGDITH